MRGQTASVAPSGPVLVVNFIPLAQSRESGDAPSHGGYAKTYLAGGHRALQLFASSAPSPAGVMIRADMYADDFDPRLTGAERRGYFATPFESKAVAGYVARLRLAEKLVFRLSAMVV
jgi:hypothetical protein